MRVYKKINKVALQNICNIDLIMNSVFWKVNFAAEGHKSHFVQNNHPVRFGIYSDISWSIQ